jgi:hypothetical protein
MTYVIGETCVDVLDRACVEECPVDCTGTSTALTRTWPASGPTGWPWRGAVVD